MATPGGRNGGTGSTNNRIFTLNGTADTNTNTIEARTGLGGVATDTTFNVADLC